MKYVTLDVDKMQNELCFFKRRKKIACGEKCVDIKLIKFKFIK